MPIFNVFTRKFSQFVPQNVDRPVGLTGGANSIGPFNGGSGGNNSHTITQANSFIPGQWVRVDAGMQIYVLALSDNPKDAESWWLVTAATSTQFTIQGGVTWVDFSTFTTTLPGLLPFTIGAPQYLSDTTPGLMVYTPPTLIGEVNKPLFIADGHTTGWILSARGFIEGVNQGVPDMGNLVTVTQPGNGFARGDVIYATTSPNVYAKATASGTFAQSDRVGVVAVPGDPTFMYQTEGNAVNVITQDDLGGTINPGVRYWLSANPATTGKVTAVQPTAPGQYSVPVYLPYAAAGGIITPQRSLSTSEENNDNNVKTIIAANSFSAGQAVYISGDNTYSLAKADAMPTSQVAGLIVAASGTQFTVQQDGWVNGAVTGAYVDSGFASGDILYLSPLTAGNLTPSVPVGVGQVTKPVYVQDVGGTRSGQILPQRPLPVGFGGGGGYIPMGTFTATNQSTLDMIGIFTPGFDNYQIVIENLVAANNGVILQCIFGTGVTPTWQNNNWSGGNTTNGVGQNNTSAAAMDISGNNVSFALPMANTPAGANYNGTLYVFNVNTTSNWPTINIFSTYRSTFTSTALTSSGGSQWQQPGPVTSLRIFASAGNIATATVSVFAL